MSNSSINSREDFSLAKSFIPTIVLIVTAVFTLPLFVVKNPMSVSLWIVFLIIVFDTAQDKTATLKTYLTTFASMFIIVQTIFFLGGYGLLGSLIIVFGLVGWRLVKGWSFFMSGIRKIETRIWGRPNDRRKKND